MNYYIITGTSSGLGTAIAEKLLDEKTVLFCISRRENKSLVKKAEARKSPLHYFTADLSEHQNISQLMAQVFSKMDLDTAGRVVLINNAGVLDPIGPAPRNAPEKIHQNIHVNLMAPIILSSLFIQRLEQAGLFKSIVNISSGAATRPIWGWSCYCAAKAAVDMYTRTVAEEQKGAAYPVRIFSFAPGIVDTPMQEKIRQAPKSLFKDRDNFIAYQKKGHLLDPQFVAEKVIAVTKDTETENGSLLHV